MNIIYNRHFPFGSFFAINIMGFVFCRSDKGRMTAVDRNHEYIHTLQQREMFFLPFYVWYLCEWLYNIIRCRNAMAAYYAIRFEREAYSHQSDLAYRYQRRHFAWLRL